MSDLLTRPDRGGVLAALVGDDRGFLRDEFGRRPWFRAAGAARLPRFTLHDVDALLGSALLRRPFFRVVQDGATIPAGEYTRAVRLSAGTSEGVAERAKVLDLMGRGATLVLESAHRYVPALGRWCADLAVDLELPTQANVYVTPARGQGFAAHVDSHDVFVLHLSGTKAWTIRERSRQLPFPVRADRGRLNQPATVDAPVRAQWDFGPGSVAYLPRGFPHEAAAGGDGPSMHVTVGVVPPTLDDVAREVVTRRTGPLRRAVPRPRWSQDEPEAVDLGGPITGDEFRAVLARRMVAALTPPTGPSLTTRMSGEGGPGRATGAVGLVPVAVALDRSDTEDGLTLVLPDREVDVAARGAAATEAVLRAATRAGGVRLDDLSGDEAAAAEGLVAAGVLGPVEDDDDD